MANVAEPRFTAIPVELYQTARVVLRDDQIGLIAAEVVRQLRTPQVRYEGFAGVPYSQQARTVGTAS